MKRWIAWAKPTKKKRRKKKKRPRPKKPRPSTGWIPEHYIGELAARDPKEAKALILQTLNQTGGSTVKAQQILGISPKYLWHLSNKLGIPPDEPEKIRKACKERFRLPPWGE